MQSKTSLETYFTCQKKYEYSYINRMEPKHRSNEMQFGLGGHAVLEQAYKGVPLDQLSWSSWPLSPLELRKAKALVDAHLRLYPPRAEYYGVEHAWELPKAGIKGVFDAVYLDGNECVVVEHKTTKTDISNADWYWDKLRTDWQVGLYQLAADALVAKDGQETVVLYNVLRVPQLRQGKHESEDDYIQRITDDIKANPGRYFQQARIKWTAASLAKLEDDIRIVDNNLATQKEYPRSRRCFDFMRRCEYYPACFEGKSISDPDLYQIKVKR